MGKGNLILFYDLSLQRALVLFTAISIFILSTITVRRLSDQRFYAAKRRRLCGYFCQHVNDVAMANDGYPISYFIHIGPAPHTCRNEARSVFDFNIIILLFSRRSRYIITGQICFCSSSIVSYHLRGGLFMAVFDMFITWHET